jgi:diguanylate cyclase (GGDEF)-like protein
MVVLLIDLDRFKPINDHLGHHVGDHVLASVGARLRATLGRGAVLGRLGGDEFAAVVRVGAVDTPWPDLLLHLVHELHTPIAVPGVQRPVTVGVSVGAIHCADLNRPALSALLQTAEGLMYQAKRGGGGLVASVADPADAQLIRPVPCRPRRRRRDALATPAESPPRHRSPNCRTR